MYNYLWGLGVVIAILSSFLTNLGTVFQKLYHIRGGKKYWFAGLVMMGTGALGDVVALVFASQVLVASLGPTTLVANIVLAPIVLKEVVSKHELVCTAIIIVGSTVSIVFGPHKVALKGMIELMNIFFSFRFLIYLSTVLATLFTLSRIALKHPIACYATMSGIYGGHSILFCKMAVELFQTSIVFDNIDTKERKYMFQSFFALVCVLLVSCVTFQVYYLNRAFEKKGEALRVLPIFQTFWVSFSIFSALVFFNDFTSISITYQVLFVGGIITNIIGLYVLFKAPPKSLQAGEILSEFTIE